MEEEIERKREMIDRQIWKNQIHTILFVKGIIFFTKYVEAGSRISSPQFGAGDPLTLVSSCIPCSAGWHGKILLPTDLLGASCSFWHFYGQGNTLLDRQNSMV